MSGWLQKLRERFTRKKTSLPESAPLQSSSQNKLPAQEAVSPGKAVSSLSPLGHQTPSKTSNPWLSAPPAGSSAVRFQVPAFSGSTQQVRSEPEVTRSTPTTAPSRQAADDVRPPTIKTPSSPSQGSPWVKGGYPTQQASASETPAENNSFRRPESIPDEKNAFSVAMLARALNSLKNTHQVSLEKSGITADHPGVPRKIILAGSFATEASRLKSEGVLRSGMQVTLKHIPNNKYDSRAIEVALGGIQIGWIPKTKNAQLLDAGATELRWKILAVKNVKKREKQIAIEIYSPDLFKMKSKPKPTKNLPSVKRPEFSNHEELRIVYKILCQDRVIYVGSTTRGLKARKSQHLSALRRGSHTNAELQEAFNNHGEDEFQFVKVRKSDDGESIRVRELNVMKRYKPKEYKKTKQRLLRFSQ
jgi:hypothetical protein